MSNPSASYVTVLRQLVEEDIAKQMGRPIHNKYILTSTSPSSYCIALHQFVQVLVDLPGAGLPVGADCDWAFHSGHLARRLGAL